MRDAIVCFSEFLDDLVQAELDTAIAEQDAREAQEASDAAYAKLVRVIGHVAAKTLAESLSGVRLERCANCSEFCNKRFMHARRCFICRGSDHDNV